MKRQIGALIVLFMLAGTAMSQEQVTVDTARSDQYGRYLVDAEGMTLYLFEASEPSGERFTQGVRDAAADCTGRCLEVWPPLDAPGGVTAAGAVDSDLLYIENVNGINQVVYNGWPLYYFVRDEQPGQINGQGIEGFGGEWYIVGPDGTPVEHEETAGAGDSGAADMQALGDVHGVLMEGGLATGPDEESVAALREWRNRLARSDRAADETLNAAVEAVLFDLEAQAFDPAQAAESLERLALTMRVIASGEVPDRASLLVELASLVSQTSALYESGDFKPRLEVDVP